MTFDAERQALETRFEDNWSYTPVHWPNTKLETEGLTEWVRYANIPDSANIAGLGGGSQQLYRYHGMVVVQIFVMPNSGAARALQLAELVSDIWRSARFSGLTMQATKIEIVGINQGWYQIDAISPYHRDSYESRSVL